MTASLHIGFLLDQLGIGGTELNAVRTTEELRRRGHRVTAFVLSDPPGPLARRYAAAGAAIELLPIRSLYGVASVRMGVRLRGLLRSLQIDVLHCHDIYSNTFGAFWGRRRGGPALVTSKRWSTDLLPAKYAALNRWAYARSDRVLANSRAVGESLRTIEQVAAQRIAVVTNFLTDESFAPPEPGTLAALRRAAGVPEHDGETVLGIVARLSIEKNHAMLLEAFARVRREHGAGRLLVIGDGPERDSLESLAQSLEIADVVHFTGRLDVPWNLHFLADISLLSSRTEGFPNSVVEGMAAGRPVIATRVGGVPDAVEDGIEGLLVPSDDTDRFAAAIRSLLGDPLLARRLAEAGHARARREFSSVVVMQQLEALYASIVDQ